MNYLNDPFAKMDQVFSFKKNIKKLKTTLENGKKILKKFGKVGTMCIRTEYFMQKCTDCRTRSVPFSLQVYLF